MLINHFKIDDQNSDNNDALYQKNFFCFPSFKKFTSFLVRKSQELSL